MKNIDDYISLTEYAKIYGLHKDTIRQRCLRGSFQTAKKIGKMWVIDKNEKPIDNRIKSGKYKNWRKK